MEKEQEVKLLRYDDYYRERIIEIVKRIKNPKIIECIYVFASDIQKEDFGGKI